MAVRIERGNFEDARLVRERVFVEEQGFENEFDETDADPSTIHLTLYADGRLAGCARTFPDPDDSNVEGSTAPLAAAQDGADARACWVFGRLAVLPEAPRRIRHASSGRGRARRPRERCRLDALARTVPRRRFLRTRRLRAVRPRGARRARRARVDAQAPLTAAKRRATSSTLRQRKKGSAASRALLS